MEKRLTLSMPCYLRPQRTIRAIECIANQNIDNWEALVTGDGCPVIKDYLESNTFKDVVDDCKKRGNDLIITNNRINKGGNGYFITNHNIQIAKGEFFIFFANDDIITKDHFKNYLSEIENTDLDFVYFNSWIDCLNKTRISQLKYGHIGHSELIIRTSFLKKMPAHSHKYGHDFDLIRNMIENTEKYKKANSNLTTYFVMSLPKKQEQNIN